MDEVKNIIDDLGIAAFEASMQIAGFAVISDGGEVVYQTSNWDLTNETHIISNLVEGASSFVLSGGNFSVVDKTADGIVATSDSGMGHVLFVPFQGGVLVSYAMPGADPTKIISFLKPVAMNLTGKV
jgi:hypothetical protein